MPTPVNSTMPSGSPGTSHPDHRRPVTAELQFLLIAIVFVVMMLLAGVPGRENKAGDGSPALQRGWAERHAAEVAAQQAGSADAAPTALPSAPENDR